MLEDPKTLDTKNIISKKIFKDIAMGNQQVTKIINMLWVGSSETICSYPIFIG